MRHLITLFSMAIVLVAISCQSGSEQNVVLNFPEELPQAQFASKAIAQSLADAGLKVQTDGKQPIFLFTLNDEEAIKKHGFSMPSGLKNEGFSLQVNDNKLGVIGHDAAGLMYGGLELAEQIAIYGIKGVKPVDQNPRMEMRGSPNTISPWMSGLQATQILAMRHKTTSVKCGV
jgi:N-acetyl-beta-hexosaminidase